MPALFQKILKTRIVTERLGPDEAEFIQLVRQVDEKSKRLLGRALALPPMRGSPFPLRALSPYVVPSRWTPTCASIRATHRPFILRCSLRSHDFHEGPHSQAKKLPCDPVKPNPAVCRKSWGFCLPACATMS